MTHPWALLGAFVGLVAFLQAASALPAFRKIFRFLPVPFWCYFLPMTATTLKWIPESSPLYSFLSAQLLPVCLVLLLIGTDLKSLARMGRAAMLLMLIGAAGTAAGGLISFRLYHRWLPAEAWGGIGALTGSWIGGSANMLAVKEALQLPDRVIAPLIIVDAAVAYSWMALLVWSSSQQARWDVLVRASTSLPVRQAGSARTLPTPSVRPEPVEGRMDTPSRGLAAAIALAILFSLAAQWISRKMPAMGPAFSASTWTILIVTSVSLLLSLTPVRKLEEAGASRIGSLALYVLLASIGARANLTAVTQAPVFLALGATWILIHGVVLLAGGYLLKAPLGLIATASQANIGGTISAPLVGATFSTELAGLGLLMAIFGNLIGTYAGLATALAARNLPF